MRVAQRLPFRHASAEEVDEMLAELRKFGFSFS
jgi:hypothetical protein